MLRALDDDHSLRSLFLISGVALTAGGFVAIGIYIAIAIGIIIDPPSDGASLWWSLALMAGGVILLCVGVGLIYAWRSAGTPPADEFESGGRLAK